MTINLRTTIILLLTTVCTASVNNYNAIICKAPLIEYKFNLTGPKLTWLLATDDADADFTNNPLASCGGKNYLNWGNTVSNTLTYTIPQGKVIYQCWLYAASIKISKVTVIDLTKGICGDLKAGKLTYKSQCSKCSNNEPLHDNEQTGVFVCDGSKRSMALNMTAITVIKSEYT